MIEILLFSCNNSSFAIFQTCVLNTGRKTQLSDYGPYRQWGELVTAKVERLQLGPLVDAEGQFWDLITAKVESLQTAQWIEALWYPSQVVTWQVNIWRRTETKGTHVCNEYKTSMYPYLWMLQAVTYKEYTKWRICEIWMFQKCRSESQDVNARRKMFYVISSVAYKQ